MSLYNTAVETLLYETYDPTAPPWMGFLQDYTGLSIPSMLLYSVSGVRSTYNLYGPFAAHLYPGYQWSLDIHGHIH